VHRPAELKGVFRLSRDPGGSRFQMMTMDDPLDVKSLHFSK